MSDVQNSRRRGRSSFSSQVADRICDRLMDGESLRQICRDPTMPARSSIFNWLQDHREFADEYALAKQFQIYDLYDEILVAARSCELNDEDIRRNNVKIGALKWLVTKLSAKKYRVRKDWANEQRRR